MAYDFQLAVDAARPHELAEWWAQTLGWVVEESDEDFIRKMIADGYATEGDTLTFNGQLVWATGASICHPDNPATGTRKRVIFQQVPEAKTAKNRWHIDVWVGKDKVQSVSEALAARGATFLYEGQQGPHTWVTMADPEGNEFCVS
jgi:hypothetical protein